MEAKQNKKEGVESESFVTGSYLKQLEIQKEGQMVTQIEEQLNQRKTANAERGMTGFAKYLGRIRGVENEGDDLDDQAAD